MIGDWQELPQGALELAAVTLHYTEQSLLPFVETARVELYGNRTCRHAGRLTSVAEQLRVADYRLNATRVAAID